jgi:hypothetical protein
MAEIPGQLLEYMSRRGVRPNPPPTTPVAGIGAGLGVGDMGEASRMPVPIVAANFSASGADSAATAARSPSSFAASAAAASAPDRDEQRLCVVCLSAARDSTCVPCGHVAGCFECLNDVKTRTGKCPICRQRIGSVMRIFNP